MRIPLRTGPFVLAGLLLLAGFPARAVEDQITIYTPSFEGPPALASSVSTVLNLQIWQTLRRKPARNPGELSFGKAVLIWGGALGEYSHKTAESRAEEISLLAQMVFWGKVYEFGEGAIAQTHLSIPEYKDFRTEHPERWVARVRKAEGWIEFSADIPQRRYSFEPMALTREVISRYSHPGALLMYSGLDGGKVVGTVGDEFTALEQHANGAKVRSGNVTGWVRLPRLSAERTGVVDFVGGIIRVFRGDWEGVESLMSRVIADETAPNEIRTDAFLYKGMAAARQGKPSEPAFAEARKLSPNARRCVVYTVLGKLWDYSRLQGGNSGAKVEILQDARRLLEESSYLFEPDDPWFSDTMSKLGRLM
jgi:hypothetical protein